jgi:Putative serine dehydratase domain
MRLPHLQGRRLRPQPRPRRRADQELQAEPLCLGDGDEPSGGGPRDRRRGLKALAFDSGPPLVCDEPAATYERASDEHGKLAVSAAANRLGLGDKIRLIPGHCDPTVKLYDWYVCIRNNRVEQLWPITARGAVY